MNAPRVTIGMPVFNGEPFVGEAVASLLEQTYEDFVLVISDDGSEDATPSICAELARTDPRVRFVRQERHLGMTRNFDFVLAEATTPYVLWAAQDDLWAPTFLERTVALLERDPSAIGATTAIRFVTPAGDEIRMARIPAAMAATDPVVRARAVSSDGYHAIYGLLRRERVLASAVRLEDVPAPDVAFVFGLALHGRFATSREPLSTRRVLGYTRVMTPGGRVRWEKALGPDGRLYEWGRAPLARAMLRHVRAAPIPVDAKLRVLSTVGRVWWSGLYRRVVEQTGRLPARTAWGEGRLLRAGALVTAQAVLRPRRAAVEARRMLAARRRRR